MEKINPATKSTGKNTQIKNIRPIKAKTNTSKINPIIIKKLLNMAPIIRLKELDIKTSAYRLKLNPLPYDH